MKAVGPIPAGFAAAADGSLAIGGERAELLVEQAGGTPLFVYDRGKIGEQVARFRAGMPDNVALHYAVKANPYGPLLSFIADKVDGFDVASAGELGRVAHPVEIGTGAEIRAGATQDDGAHTLPDTGEELDGLADQLVVERVVDIGAVEGDGENFTVFFREKRLVSHGADSNLSYLRTARRLAPASN